MGCLTGAYLIIQGDLKPEDILPLMRELFSFVVSFTGEIPGANPRDCGNFSFMNLRGAKEISRAFLDEILADPAPENLNYPA